MTKTQYTNFNRLNNLMETAIRDAEIRAFYDGLSYNELGYDKKISICSKKFSISYESIRRFIIQKPKISSILLGSGGEYLTCFKAIMEGYAASPINHLAYDVVIDDHPNIYRVQVKTSRYYGERPSCIFQLRRRSMNYKTKMSKDYKYNKNDFELYAFVEPDQLKVAFIPRSEITTTCKYTINPKLMDKYTLKRAIKVLNG